LYGQLRAAAYHIADVRCPHRLEAQDGALSRPKLEFESPWGHNREPLNQWLFVLYKKVTVISLLLFTLPECTVKMTVSFFES
jgi:hypothetical protein